VDFVPLHDINSFRQGNPLIGLVDGGTVFVPTPLTDPNEIWAALPSATRAEMKARNIRLLALDTASLAKQHAPRPELEIRMQGVALVGVFLKVSPFAERAGLDRPALRDAVRTNLTRFFGKRGKSVVDANLAVIDGAYDGVIDVTAAIADDLAAPVAVRVAR
jgi:pyruvate-ferredoxin/flavodoxin oxidoreductase